MAILSDDRAENIQALAQRFIESRPGDTLGPEINRGGSSVVFEISVAGARRALKVYDPEFFEGEEGKAEHRRLRLQERLIQHPCPELVQLYLVEFRDATAFVEMEYVHGVDLSEMIQTIPVEKVQRLISQLVRAVQYLESLGLVHRDIKPANIRVSSDLDRLTLLDLGVVRELADRSGSEATAHGNRKPFIATAQYSSPEYLFWLHQPDSRFWHALSLYQVGAVLHDLITRRALFAEEVLTGNRYVLAMSVLQRVPVFPGGVPTRLAALSARCLTKDMDRRLQMAKWEDFDQAQVSVQSVADRMARIVNTGLSTPADALRQHARDLDRTRLTDEVMSTLHGRIQLAIPGSQLERTKSSLGPTLGLRIPNTELLVRLVLSLRWLGTEKEDTAAVGVRCILAPSISLPIVRPENVCIDTNTLTSSSPAQVVDALVEYFVGRVDAALDIVEAVGADLGDVVDLNETRP